MMGVVQERHGATNSNCTHHQLVLVLVQASTSHPTLLRHVGTAVQAACRHQAASAAHRSPTAAAASSRGSWPSGKPTRHGQRQQQRSLGRGECGTEPGMEGGANRNARGDSIVPGGGGRRRRRAAPLLTVSCSNELSVRRRVACLQEVSIRRRPPHGIDAQACGPVDFKVTLQGGVGVGGGVGRWRCPPLRACLPACCKPRAPHACWEATSAGMVVAFDVQPASASECARSPC